MKRNPFKVTCAVVTMLVSLVLGCIFGPRVDSYVAHQKAGQPLVEPAGEVNHAVVSNLR